MAEAAGGERWSLAGAMALVTGGSKGIGHAIVEELASLGARVHTCSRNAAELEECRRRWAEKGLQVTVSVCDVAVRADREALLDAVKGVFAGKLDILVNNAAQFIVKPATECTAEDYARIMAINLESCFHLSQLAHLHRRQWKHRAHLLHRRQNRLFRGRALLRYKRRDEPAHKEPGC